MEPLEPPNWQPVTEPRTVRRFVQHDSPDHPDFPLNFLPDGENPDKQSVDESEHPGFRLGMSVFLTEEQARTAWADILNKLLARGSSRNKRRKRPPKIKVGHYIADVLLTPGDGFEIAGPPDERGHVTLRGDKDKLAAATVHVYAAARPDI